MVAKKNSKSDKKSSSKFKDVSKPGETPASSNARPTITGHNPSVKNDPMVAFSSSKSNDEPKNDKPKEEEAKKDDNQKSYGSRSKIVINPISKDSDADKDKEDKEVKEDKQDNKDEGSESEEKADDKAGESSDENEQDKKTEDAEEKSSSAGSDSAAIDAVAQTADAKKAESKQEEEKRKHEEYIDGLVKSGGYRLPIIEGGHKGSAERLISWIFFLLLIASAGVYLAIDGGYLDVGFNVPFEFINN